jgi:ElaA protein
VHWTCKRFDELSIPELYEIMLLRQRVFVVEQKCPYLDADGADPRALHLWGAERGGPPLAYLRLFAPDPKTGESKLGRVVTAPEIRRTGAGRALMQRGFEELEQRFGKTPIRIGAQAYLERFYASLGFEVAGPGYLEDDIPHLPMLRPKAPAASGKPPAA